jgi:hypothetical protein
MSQSRLSGESTIILTILDRDTVFSSTWSSAGTALEYYIDPAIPLFPMRKPTGWQIGLRVNTLHSLNQNFHFHVNELDGSASLARSAVGSGTLDFGIFQMTKDVSTGLERPFDFLSVMSFNCSATLGAMSSTLTFNHLTTGSGPYGPIYTNADYDIVDESYFTAAAEGLMTSIQFGWRRSGSTGINTMAGSITFKGLSLLVY